MNKAHETTGIVNCCVGDEYLRQTLPILQGELETCQKSLTGYLEKVRKKLQKPFFFYDSYSTEAFDVSTIFLCL